MREVGPIEAPPPEPVDFVVPRMSPEIAIYKPLVWRVTESDLAPLADWLIPKLSRSWPRLNDGAIIHWLRSSISDPHFLLIAGGFQSYGRSNYTKVYGDAAPAPHRPCQAR